MLVVSTGVFAPARQGMARDRLNVVDRVTRAWNWGSIWPGNSAEHRAKQESIGQSKRGRQERTHATGGGGAGYQLYFIAPDRAQRRHLDPWGHTRGRWPSWPSRSRCRVSVVPHAGAVSVVERAHACKMRRLRNSSSLQARSNRRGRHHLGRSQVRTHAAGGLRNASDVDDTGLEAETCACHVSAMTQHPKPCGRGVSAVPTPPKASVATSSAVMCSLQHRVGRCRGRDAVPLL